MFEYLIDAKKNSEFSLEVGWMIWIIFLIKSYSSDLGKNWYTSFKEIDLSWTDLNLDKITAIFNHLFLIHKIYSCIHFINSYTGGIN